MVNGLHLYSAFIQSAVQFMPLIHPFTHTFTHTFTHQRRLAAMQGTNQLVRSNWGLGVLLKDTSTRPGWDRTGNPLTARRQFLPPELYRPRRYSDHYITCTVHTLHPFQPSKYKATRATRGRCRIANLPRYYLWISP